MQRKLWTRIGGFLAGPLFCVALAVAIHNPAFGQQPGAQPPGDIRQGDPQNDSQDDPRDAPNHGVARISFLNGNVAVVRGDGFGQSSVALMNDPLVAGDRIVVSDNARAELQFDSFNILRAAPGSEVRMGDLAFHRYQVQIAQGMVTFRVARDVSSASDAQVEISMPSCSLRPLRAGLYRVVVRPDGSSEMTVRAGEAEVFSPAGSERLPAGTTLLSRGTVNDPEFMSVAAVPFDDWDRWNADRDRFFEQRLAEAPRYAGADIEGTEDLNGYGRWTNDPSYGEVWVPNVPQDWAPYQDGQWTSLDYYGWTWVGNEPWGWAPYHYGRWFHGPYGWGWAPGAYGGRNYWRPALVGFVGWGSPSFGASFGLGFGHFGWVALAPHEAFRPWYGRGFSGGGGLTIASSIRAEGSYRNARFANAVTGVRAGEFGRASSFSRGSFVHPSAGELAGAGTVGGPPAGVRSFNNAADNGRFYSSQNRYSQNQVRQNGAAQSGWRRFETPTQGAQAVRISPSIVNNRGYGSAYSGSPNAGGFGGPRPSYPVAPSQPGYGRPATPTYQPYRPNYAPRNYGQAGGARGAGSAPRSGGAAGGANRGGHR